MSPFLAAAQEVEFDARKVSFTFTGSDDLAKGDFFLHGEAHYDDQEGLYICREELLHYSLSDEKLPSRIVLSAALGSFEGRDRLYLSGKWHDESGDWIFHGLLKSD